MRLFYIILTDLLMPPCGFVTLVACGLVLASRGRRIWRRVGMLTAWGGVLVLLLSAMPIVPSALRLGLEAGLDLTPPTTPPGAIVVLGGEVATNARQGGEYPGFQLGALSAGRVGAAVRLQAATGLPILVTGGGVVGATVGELMHDKLIGDYHLTQAQAPDAWVDRQAQNTWENAQNAAAILRKAGIDRVYLVTDGWHMRRALIAFGHAGLQAVPAPVALTTRPTPLFDDFLPRAASWQETYYAVHEWLGCAYYAMPTLLAHPARD